MARETVQRSVDDLRERAIEIRHAACNEDISTDKGLQFAVFANGMAYGMRIAADLLQDAITKRRDEEPTRIRDIVELEPTLRYLAANHAPPRGAGGIRAD